MHCAYPIPEGPTHDVAPTASLRSSAPIVSPTRAETLTPALPSRPTLLPLSFVLMLVGVVGFGSSALTLGVAFLLFGRPPATIQTAASAPIETKTVTVTAPLPQPVQEKPTPPAPNTLAVLPFEMLFEPTPLFRREIEKLNATAMQQLADEGKLRVRPQAETAPLRYCRDPIAAARDLKVRAILVVKFTMVPEQKVSTCHLELIDAVTGFLLWGTEIEAPGGFLKHPECLTAIRQSIVENVPHRMVPQ